MITNARLGKNPLIFIYASTFVIVSYSYAFGVLLSLFPAYACAVGVSSLEIGILFGTFGVTRTLTHLFS